jgi:DNA-3-methyladenine glycosylase II
VPSLLEALCWTVIGQQINLSFAYTLKKRLVETYGEELIHEGRRFMLFPSAERLALLPPEELQALKFSRFKAETLLLVARLIAEKELSKEQLLLMGDFRLAEDKLMEIRGIGPWTAQYVSMRCLRNPDAFPLSDVGLHHAIRIRLGQTVKPSLSVVETMGRAWQPWRAYATFYLWRTLY